MKRISQRMVLLLILIGALLLGVLGFMGNYFLNAGKWVVFPGSPHVYDGVNLSSGRVTDRTGVLLLDSTDGRTYSEDAALRQATMHLLGDRFGYISAPVLNEYADELVGFSKVNGLYSLTDTANTAVLTISAQVQKTAQAALAGRRGTIGVYNYKTGEILCAVTAPTYDPDDMPDVEGDVTGAYEGVYLNRFFQTTYVPGSIFKVLTSIAAIENIPDLSQRTFTCNGTWDVGGDTIVCNGVHGTETFQQALAHSCNVAFGQLAVELGPALLTEYAEKLGIETALEFDGITTAPGSFDLEGAADSQVAWAGIGQYTDLINPCQYMVLMGAIAGGGHAAVPYLMARVEGGLTDRYTAKTTDTGPLMDAATAGQLADLMRYNVVNVYGAGQFPDLKVCAKSGTAELGEGTTPNATFAGFIQDEDYPLAFIVIVENGGSGSATCAPIAGQVLTACVAAMQAEGAD